MLEQVLTRAFCIYAYPHPAVSPTGSGGVLTGECDASIRLTKSKRARITKNADTCTPESEKRGARFKKSCPKNIQERVVRVLSQRCTLNPQIIMIFLPINCFVSVDFF